MTEAAGLAAGGNFGEGIAVGDYNVDGYPDIYLTGYGKNILYRNNGNGTFTDVTEKAGVANPNWSTSAVWFDYDNDGKLDLFVCNFVDYSAKSTVSCGKNDYTSTTIAFRACLKEDQAPFITTTAMEPSPRLVT